MSQYVVTKKIGDKIFDCRFSPNHETGLGSYLGGRRGVLVPSQGPEMAIFPGEKSAHRAAMRTMRIANKLRSSLVSELPRLKAFLTPGEFGIRVIN